VFKGNIVSKSRQPLDRPLTGALLDRLTHHVSILTMNRDSYLWIGAQIGTPVYFCQVIDFA
jgi:hypothetical protein